MVNISVREILLEKDKPLKSLWSNRIYCDKSQVLNTLSTCALIERYRFPSDVISQIVNAVKKNIEPQGCVYRAYISLRSQVSCADFTNS